MSVNNVDDNIFYFDFEYILISKIALSGRPHTTIAIVAGKSHDLIAMFSSSRATG